MDLIGTDVVRAVERSVVGDQDMSAAIASFNVVMVNRGSLDVGIVISISVDMLPESETTFTIFLQASKLFHSDSRLTSLSLFRATDW
jgi:hypothetical protein